MSHLKGIALESDETQLQKLRERLRQMSVEELIKFGKTVRGLSAPHPASPPNILLSSPFDEGPAEVAACPRHLARRPKMPRIRVREPNRPTRPLAGCAKPRRLLWCLEKKSGMGGYPGLLGHSIKGEWNQDPSWEALKGFCRE